MWKVHRPTITASACFAACISRIRNEELRTRLEQASPEIAAAAETYSRAAAKSSLYQLSGRDFELSRVSEAEIIGVYEYRMAKKESAGRHIYDGILMRAAFGRCPLCGQRDVATLDHYLPKSNYPASAVDPVNLIPASSDCNKAKGDRTSTSCEEQTLHPYFDDVEGECWLQATVVETVPPAVVFFVAPPQSWSATLQARVRRHFDIFRLATLYASQAAQELNSIQYYLEQLCRQAGPEQVMEYLADQYESRRRAQLNSWQAATYKALSGSTWFCSGGFAV